MFLNREEAGIKLASHLLRGKNLENAVIVSIPRGGVVVGASLSKFLSLPHKALIVKKIGAPHNPELAMGATGSDSIVFWDDEIIRSLGVSKEEKEDSLKKTVSTIKKREKNLGLEKLNIKGKSIIVVDDGVATGATAIAAALILKRMGAIKIILATPVIAKHTKGEIKKYFDKIISVLTPSDFHAVGEFYREFPQVEDEEVKEILNIKNKI